MALPTTKNEAGRLVWEQNGVKITLDTNAGTYTMSSKDGSTTLKLPSASQEAGFNQTINLGPLSMTVSSVGNGKFSFTTPIGVGGTVSYDFPTGQITKIDASYKRELGSLIGVSAEFSIFPANVFAGIEFSTDVKLAFKLAGKTLFSDSRHYDVKAGNALEFVNLLGDGFKDTFRINDLLKLYNKNPDGTMKDITLPDGTVMLEGDIDGKFYSITITDYGVTEFVYIDSSKTQLIAKNWIDDNNFYQREAYSTDAAGNKTTLYTDFADVFNSTVIVAQRSTLVRNDGSQQVLLDKDGNGAFEESYEYIAGGAADTHQIWADNGTTKLIDWDQGSEYVWAVKNTVWDAQGSIDYTEEFSDDGTITKNDFDQTSSFSWMQLRTVWDAQGRNDYTEEFSDDGTITKNDFDQTSSFSWMQLRSVWDVQGRVDYTEEFFDDGTITKNDFDQTSSFSWKESRSVWDAQGRVDYTVEFSDDGTITKNDFDQTNSFSWKESRSVWDAQGRVDYTVEFSDNGVITKSDFDQSLAFDWNVYKTAWDPQGRKDIVNIEYDNGSKRNYDYDSAGAIDYQSWALSDGNRGWEDYSNGTIFGYDKWDHVAGTRADVRSWNNKDLDASRIDYGWERYDDYVGWDRYSRKSWDIHRTDKFYGANGEMHSWKLDDKNYGWHFKSFSNGAVMYESVENGRLSTEHNLTNPFNGQPGNVLFVRAIPTWINWSNINVDA